MDAFFQFVTDMWASLLPEVRAMMIIIAGWLLATLTRFLISWVPAKLGFDRFCDRMGFGKFLKTGNVPYLPSKLLGIGAFWVVLLGTLFFAARVLDITLVNSVADGIASFLPSFVAFVFIVVSGLAISSFIGNFTLTLARNAGMHGARLLSKAIKYSVATIAIISALNQLNIDGTVLVNLISIAFAALAFGLALAYGLGCKDIARASLERFLKNLRESEREGTGGDLEG